MLRRGQVVTAVAAVLSPLVFALGVPTVFPGGPSGGSHRPSVTDRRLLGTGAGTSPRGLRLWVDPRNAAAVAVMQQPALSVTDAALVRKLAGRPQALWVGEWFTPAQVRSTLDRTARAAEAVDAVPVVVLYGMPVRGCGRSSSAGLSAPAAYRAWVDGVSAGLRGHRALVVVEPDSLASLDCLDPDMAQARIAAIAYAVDNLRLPGVSTYVDAGNALWKSPDVVAARLRAAGVLRARGFSLNVANFDTTTNELAYGRRVSLALGGAVPFVVDTSRNGRGPWTGSLSWCNPPGRGLGAPPTTSYPDPLVDALLWVKTPGRSDGTCRGGPPAGQWWQSYALALARNAPW